LKEGSAGSYENRLNSNNAVSVNNTKPTASFALECFVGTKKFMAGILQIE